MASEHRRQGSVKQKDVLPMLPEPHPGRERLCDSCNRVQTPSATVPQGHRVYVRFERQLSAWQVEFLSPGLRNPLCRPLRFADSGKIEAIIDRVAEVKNLEARNMLARAIQSGRCGFWTELSHDEIRTA